MLTLKGSHHAESVRKRLAEKSKKAWKDGKLDNSRKYFFKNGQSSWNKGKSMHLSPGTEWKNGQIVGEKHPQWNGGVQITKDDGVYLWAGKNKRKRRARDVYEKAYGKIPHRRVIFHMNGDMNDDRPENLVAITRKELYNRNMLKRYE